jgi:hypothetical protein
VTESVDQQALVAIFQTALEALPAMRPALKFIKEIVTFEPLISTIPLIQENDYKQAVPRVVEELRALAKKIKVNYGQIFIKDCVTLTDCQHLGSSSNLLEQSIAVTDQIKRLKAGNQDLDRSQLPKVIPFTSQAKMLESILKGDATAPGSQETKVKPPAAPRTFVSKWSRTISAVGHELVKQLATFVGTAADEDKNEWTVIPEPRELVDDSKWPKYELKADSPIPSSEFWQLKLDPSAQGDGKSTG